jgi:ATP-dependent Clp protease adapter protein ClpS
MPGTQTIPAPKIQPAEPEVAADSGWKVLLYNDEVHDFGMVIFALQRAAGLSLEVAEMVALECHQEGEAVVKRGLEKDEALIICGGLRKWTRIEGVTPGVECEAARDDA